MRLWYHPTSPYSRKASVAVRLLEAPVDLRVLDVMSGEHKQPAFLARSPFGKIPVLQTDDGDLIESTSIVELLDARFGPRLIPARVALEARRWDRIGDLYLLEPQGTLLFQGGTDAARAALGTVEGVWALLADALSDGRSFLTGPAFTLADLSPAIGTDHLLRMGFTPPPAVADWCARCFAIDAMAQERAEGAPLMDVFLGRRVPTVAS